MIKFTTYTEETAPTASKEILSSVIKTMKHIPNFMGKIAESPTTLKAYLSLGKLLENSSFTAEQQQIILLVVSRENGCTYCVAVHSMTAKLANVSDKNIDALRKGECLQDPKLEGLQQFVKAVVRERGMLKDGQLKSFIDLGYTRENVLDAITAVAMKTISNYANHIMDTELDPAMQQYKWEG